MTRAAIPALALAGLTTSAAAQWTGTVTLTSSATTVNAGDVFTIGVNLAGLPALSIPAGFSNGLPVGLHVTGNYFQEARLLNVGHQYQQVSDWHTRCPQGFE